MNKQILKTISTITILICLITLMISCNSNNEHLSKIDLVLNSNITYEGMDGNHCEGCAIRPKKDLMNKILKQTKGYYKTQHFDENKVIWNENGIIEVDIDGDSINDYLVLTIVTPSLPKYDVGEYKVYGIIGENYKCFEIESFPLYIEDVNNRKEEAKLTFKDFELLPEIRIEKKDGVNTFFIQSHPTAEVYNPYYFDTDNNKFDVLTYD